MSQKSSTRRPSLGALAFIHIAIGLAAWGAIAGRDPHIQALAAFSGGHHDDHGKGSEPASGTGGHAPAGGGKPAPKLKAGKPPVVAQPSKSAPEHEGQGETATKAAAEHEVPHGEVHDDPARTQATAGADEAEHAAQESAHPDADAALSMLKSGNLRWLKGNLQHPHSDASTRAQTATEGQEPFAAILTCADSRIPVERVFDCGVGDVFVVRVAGNVAGSSETGSLEYAIEHLHTPVLVVMGHTGCGAVKAAAAGGELHGAVAEVVGKIEPAVERARQGGAEGDELLSSAVRENVWQSVFDLIRFSEPVRTAIDSKSLKVVGAIYDISSGEVTWLGEHPWQAELVAAFEARAESRHADAADQGH